MNFYLMPTASFANSMGGMFTGPKYLKTDMAGLTFTAVPYGVEGCILVALAPNPALAAEPDVFSFGISSNTLASGDVTSLGTYLASHNLPSAWVTAGMTWAQVVRQIAQIHLLAQWASGKAKGASIFSGGATLNSTIASLSAVSAGVGTGGTGSSSALVTAITAAINPGDFDFSQVETSHTIGEILTSVSQQFESPIIVGEGEI